MPTNAKPRKPAQQQQKNSIPGKVWLDLNVIYQNCLSQIHSTASVGTILKDPTFVENVVDVKRAVALAKSLASKIPNFIAEANQIKNGSEQLKASWDLIDQERKAAWKSGDRDTATAKRDQMDTIEFSAIQVGEQYQNWLSNWQQIVLPEFLELMALMQQTRQNMENKANASN